jgi:hypothetical protein
MVRDLVSFPDGPLEDIRMIRGILADDEKRGLEMPRREEIEKLRRERGIRAVIEGQRDDKPIDMDGIEGDRWFRRSWRRFGFNRNRTRLLRRDSGLGFLRERGLREQRNKRAKCDEPSEKHGDDLAEPTCNASDCAYALWKGPKTTAPTNLHQEHVSRLNPQSGSYPAQTKDMTHSA